MYTRERERERERERLVTEDLKSAVKFSAVHCSQESGSTPDHGAG